MNVVFLGTPDFAARILERLVAGRHRVLAAVCQPDRPRGRSPEPQPPPVKVLALARGLPVHQPRNLGPRFLEWLDLRKPDALLVAAYGRLLPPAVLDRPRFGCINVHPSLLPRYRGPAPIQWAIASGDPYTGVSIMQMDQGMDTGPVLAARRAAIGPEDTAAELHDRLADQGADLLLETLDTLERGPVPATPQDPERATHAPILTRDHGRIDWSGTASLLACRVRGFHPWPGTWTRFRGQVLKVFPFADPEPGEAAAPAGQVLRVDPERGLCVACGTGALWLREVQQEGRRRIPAGDFARGARIEPGEVLG